MRRWIGCGPGTTTGRPPWASWSSCRPTPPPGWRRTSWSATADRLTGTFTRLGLADQARLARLLAIENLAPAAAARRALPAIRRDQPLELRLHGRLVRAQRAFGQGHRRAGLRHARIGLCDLTEYQTRFGSLDLQTSSAVRARRLAAAAIHAEIAAGHPTAVLAWVERARAVTGRVVAPQPPDDPETAELMTQLALDGRPAGPGGGDRAGRRRPTQAPAAPRAGHPGPVLDHARHCGDGCGAAGRRTCGGPWATRCW